MNQQLNAEKTVKFFKKFDIFVSKSMRGKRVKKNRTRILKDSCRNYLTLKKLLEEFCKTENFPLRLPSNRKLSTRRFMSERRYWKKFYFQFTEYLYKNKKHYDNYVSSLIKLLNCFFNYVHEEHGNIEGRYRQNFYARREEIRIVVLSVERLRFLMHDKEFESSLSDTLKRIKDIFVFGCWVALRVSDLVALTTENLETTNGRVYLKAYSKKTQTFTRVALSKHLIEILNKYKGEKFLLPYYNPVYINQYGKELMEKAGWTETFVKYRQRRGITVPVYKDPVKKIHYRFCDLVSSHLMRRTAITTMITLGMKEDVVRRISGHAAGSLEFYKYVTYAQGYLDEALRKFYKKMEDVGKKSV